MLKRKSGGQSIFARLSHAAAGGSVVNGKFAPKEQPFGYAPEEDLTGRSLSGNSRLPLGIQDIDLSMHYDVRKSGAKVDSFGESGSYRRDG